MNHRHPLAGALAAALIAACAAAPDLDPEDESTTTLRLDGSGSDGSAAPSVIAGPPGPTATSSPSSSGAPSPPSGGSCGEDMRPRLEAGCDGAAVYTCVPDGPVGATVTSWCGCAGRTIASPSTEPPRERYAFAGVCEASAKLEALPHEIAANRFRGVRVLFTAGSGIADVGLFATCKVAEATPPELSKLVCRDGDRTDTLVARARGADVIVLQTREKGGVVEHKDRELERIRLDPRRRLVGERAVVEKPSLEMPN